jgi:hypothetical protein
MRRHCRQQCFIHSGNLANDARRCCSCRNSVGLIRDRQRRGQPATAGHVGDDLTTCDNGHALHTFYDLAFHDAGNVVRRILYDFVFCGDRVLLDASERVADGMRRCAWQYQQHECLSEPLLIALEIMGGPE